LSYSLLIHSLALIFNPSELTSYSGFNVFKNKSAFDKSAPTLMFLNSNSGVLKYLSISNSLYAIGLVTDPLDKEETL
jgi:hypothetical protein